MRMMLALLPIALCFTAAAQNLSKFAPQPRTYINHVTVIDTETGKEATDQTVVISGGKIAEIGAGKDVAVPSGARIVDGRGKYLIPGLWDMHVHTWDYESTYSLYIANGVTGVRDMFGPPDAKKFRAQLAAKHLLAPHFYLASPIVDGHPAVWPESIEVTTPEQARKVVDDQKEKGADFIKVYSRLTPDAYFAIAAESARVGIPFEGHVPLQVSAWDASRAKQKTFEHLYGIDVACSTREQELQAKMVPTAPMKERATIVAEAAQSYSETKCNDLFGLLKENGNWQVPTLTVLRSFGLLNDPQFLNDRRLQYFSGEFRNWLTAKDDFRVKSWTATDYAREREQFQFSQRVVGAMFRAGVPLLAGTDTGNPYCFPGFSLHDELALLVESGLTPLAALQAATRNAAVFMKAADRYGSVAKGKIADLVLLDADPLQDIHNTTKISEVFLEGKEFDRGALDGILRAAEGNASASDQLPGTTPAGVTSSIQMQRVSRLMTGRWSGKLTTDPGWHEAGSADETWRLAPGGLTLIEENRLSTPKGDSYDYAAIWWNTRAQKYQGIWCAEINHEGCTAFDAALRDNQLEMTGEWEQRGHRRAWREVFSRASDNSSIQTLELGEPGEELKSVSKIAATKVPDGPSGALSANPHKDDILAARTKSPNPEMQKLFDAQLGRWSQREERSDGSTGDGEALWSPGPGGMSLVENEYIRDSSGEMSGLSVTWYDQDAHGYRTLWCSNKLKNGCLVMSKLAQWEGDQFVLSDEFESNGKKLDYKEVESGVTPTTYTLTSYLGEPGSELKATSTIHATKISEENVNASDPIAEAELRAFMDELRKASIAGDVDTVSNSITDDYVQTDITGYRQDKTTWLNEYFRPLADLIRQGKFHWDEYERQNLQFRFYGDCAVVTGELKAKGTGAKFGPQHTWVADSNSTFSGTLHFTHVYMKQNGGWKLAALHNQIPLAGPSTAK
ncbi:MAG TPA: amidohydrolase family protein [Terriglobales bacterium]|nr:amidohydrolase family protein [Terriglobales bacterium]